MNNIKPKSVNKNSTIGFLTISGPVSDLKKIDMAKDFFNKKGYNTTISNTTYTQKDFLAADDKTRLNQLHSFFENKDIDAILFTRGGYGATRLLEKIDYNLIRKNPKFIGGYSDATALLNTITTKCNLITYHSPMPYNDFSSAIMSDTTINSFFKALNGETFCTNLTGKIYKEGHAQGILIGGNLATLASMIGFDFLPNEKFILFIEDINEPAYKIDRYMTQLFFDKKFKKHICGLVLGAFSGLDNQKYFDNIFTELGTKTNIPIISGLKIGHVQEQITIPIGIKAKLDTKNATLYEIEYPNC